MSAPRPRRDEVLSLAHELRTPLTSLSLAADMLEDERHGALSGVQRELARTIAREAGRLRLVLARAMNTDRLGAHAGPVDREAIDLGAVVRRALHPLYGQAAARHVDLALRVPTGIWIVGDAPKLAWAVASLVGNALRFAPPGTKVDVALARARARARLSIADRGPGVPPQIRRVLFTRETGGSLFLIQEVVHAHGGAIRLTRTAVGARFVVSLPRADPPRRGDPA